MYVLVQYKDYWQDEFQINGFSILTGIEYRRWREKLHKKRFPTRELHFGTNHWVRYNSLEEYDACLRATRMNGESGVRIRKLFGRRYGTFINPVEND
jgi:hypothetical protein